MGGGHYGVESPGELRGAHGRWRVLGWVAHRFARPVEHLHTMVLKKLRPWTGAS